MTWCSSGDVTRFSAGHRQFVGVAGSDGRHYFDVPADMVAAARAVGLDASDAPPPAPSLDRADKPPWFDEDALAGKVARLLAGSPATRPLRSPR